MAELSSLKSAPTVPSGDYSLKKLLLNLMATMKLKLTATLVTPSKS